MPICKEGIWHVSVSDQLYDPGRMFLVLVKINVY